MISNQDGRTVVTTANLTKEEANAAISALVAEAYALIHSAEAIAAEHQLGFNFDLAYGMGGYFDGKSVGETDEWGQESDGWHPSSQSC
jgi:hypothetical protein